jgi:phosphohistidine phosphatase SixA
MQLFEGVEALWWIGHAAVSAKQFEWPPFFAKRTPTSISASLRSDGVVITISSKHGIPLLGASLRSVFHQSGLHRDLSRGEQHEGEMRWPCFQDERLAAWPRLPVSCWPCLRRALRNRRIIKRVWSEIPNSWFNRCAGGYNIVVRHGATFSNQADTDPFNFDDVAKQRNLNDKGKELAKAFGDAIRQAGLPVGEVYTSKFNRAYETAIRAGFQDIEKTIDLTEGGLVVTPDENNRRAEAFRKMLAQASDKGKNNFLITHKPNIVDALGKDWCDVKEGEASIFKPEGGKYRLVARVQMEDWPKLAVTAN